MIHVIGLGPGNPDYILPIATENIRRSSMVIGAQRNIDAVRAHCIQTMTLESGFEEIAAYLKAHMTEEIAVVVSGDTGFYSMLTYVKRHVPADCIHVIPGISSLQYMYSRLGRGYEDAKWLSFHGRQADLEPLITQRFPLGILTDRDRNNRTIARQLKDYQIDDAIIYIGERLSYEDECITRLTVEECMTFEADPLSVVVIDYEL